MDVSDIITRMQDAIKSGNFTEAESIGNSTLPSLPLAIPRSDISLHTVISQGAQATVFEATLSHHSHPVAVKRAYIRETNDLVRFYQEATFLAHLSSHPHIVTMVGARLLPPEYSVVLDLEPYNAAHQLHVEGWRPSWEDILLIGSQIADALSFTHVHGIVHRDIKPANLLLDTSHTVAKLADFGIAMYIKDIQEQHYTNNLLHIKPSGGFQKGKVLGTLEYMPPEVLMNIQPHTEASDVFALAVTLNELATGIMPYSDATRDNPLAHTVLEMGYGRQELAAAVAVEGLRPTMRGDTPGQLKQLLEACWEADPSKRPTAQVMRDGLLQIVADISSSSSSRFVDDGTDGTESSMSRIIPPPSTPSVLITHNNNNTTLPLSRGMSTCSGEIHHLLDGSSPSCANDGILASSSSPPDSNMSAHDDDDTTDMMMMMPPWMNNNNNNDNDSTSSILPQFQSSVVGVYASPGLRDSMEDRHLLYYTSDDGRIVFGLFDGHRGAEAAQFLQNHLQQCLIAHGLDNDTSRTTCSSSSSSILRDALLDIDDVFRRQQDVQWSEKMLRMHGLSGGGGIDAATAAAGLVHMGKQTYPGSTALVGVLDINTTTTNTSTTTSTKKQKKTRMMTIANIGDGRAVLCRRGRAVRLTRDHTADDEEERERIINSTATTSSSIVSHRYGNWRVGSAGLQVTRSIGDADMKLEGALTAEAETHDVELDDEDDWFVVMATDGLWDVMTDQEAVQMICDTVKQPSMCAQRLVTEAIARGSRDNVTAMVAVLRADQGTSEMVWSADPANTNKNIKVVAARGRAMPVSMDEMYDTY